MNVFATIPFFRISVPFITGILVGIYTSFVFHWLFFVITLVLLILLAMQGRTAGWVKWTFLILADVFLFIYGISISGLADCRKDPFYFGNMINPGTVMLSGVITDLPVQKARSIKCEVKVITVHGSVTSRPANGKLICYFRNSDRNEQLKAGLCITFKGRLSAPEPPRNPLQFNYQRYLAQRQVYFTAFVDSGGFITSQHQLLHPLWALGLRCKSLMLSRLHSSGLSPLAYGICAALLTGYDDDIERPVMDAFAHSGTLHVLSVSGLHTGLIYLVLNFLFDQVDRNKRYKLSRLIFITLSLWLFALITGFSAPVLRAVIMFNLLGVGRAYFRSGYRNQLNILLVSAFILLNYNPFLIADVGFLLSYFAMFGLIYFQPALSAMYDPGNIFLRTTWQSVSASLSATLSTLPLTLFYFNQFPLWFIICNMIVVPATFMLLLLAALVVAGLPFAAELTNVIISWLCRFINLFNNSSYGFIDRLHFDLADALFLSVIILIFSIALQYRSFRYAKAGLATLLCWQLYSLFSSYAVKSQDILAVYNAKGQAILIKSKNVAWLNLNNQADFDYYLKPHVVSLNYPLLKKQYFNYIENGEAAVLLLDKPARWPLKSANHVSRLVLSNNFLLDEPHMNHMNRLTAVVSDGSNNRATAAKNALLCRKFGIAFHNTKEEGAYLINLR